MVYIGADHNGYRLKNDLVRFLQRRGVTVRDLGAVSARASDDYPLIAVRVARAVQASPQHRGILLCGSGNGMAMSANRFSRIRAALAPSLRYAVKAREHENANILVLPAWWMNEGTARSIAQKFLATASSAAARHRRRVRQLTRLHG